MKKITAIILSLILVIMVFASCGDNGKKNNKKETGRETETISESETQVDSDAALVDDYVDSLAASHKYDGDTFVFTGRIGQNFPTAEEETGDVVSDAIYYRQRDIEEKFGLDWVNIPDANGGDETQEKVIKDVMAAGNSYDLVYGSMILVAQRLIAANVICDFYEFTPDVDFAQPWWMNSLAKYYEINGRLYFAVGEAVYDYYDNSNCLIFNKQVQSDFNIPDLYPLVRSGDWTIDKMTEIASVIPAVNDDNGIYRYGAYGVYGIPWVFASGLTLTKFDDNGSPYLEPSLDPKLSDLADKMSNILGDDSQSLNVKWMAPYREEFETKHTAFSNAEMYFEENHCFFWQTTTRGAMDFRAADVEFGVLPLPKYDSAQNDYYAYAEQYMGGAFFVPKTVPSFEKTGVITEAMAALSHKYLKPAVYDKLLKGRSTYDFESREMIDIIFTHTVYDLLDVFSGGDANQRGEYIDLINNSVYADSSNLASSYAAITKVTSKMMDRTISKLEK